MYSGQAKKRVFLGIAGNRPGNQTPFLDFIGVRMGAGAGIEKSVGKKLNVLTGQSDNDRGVERARRGGGEWNDYECLVFISPETRGIFSDIRMATHPNIFFTSLVS